MQPSQQIADASSRKPKYLYHPSLSFCWFEGLRATAEIGDLFAKIRRVGLLLIFDLW
jgi:hypothetical protein